jgi:hypothetical protein
MSKNGHSRYSSDPKGGGGGSGDPSKYALILDSLECFQIVIHTQMDMSKYSDTNHVFHLGMQRII